MHQDPETNSAQQLASLPQFQFLLAVGMIGMVRNDFEWIRDSNWAPTWSYKFANVQIGSNMCNNLQNMWLWSWISQQLVMLSKRSCWAKKNDSLPIKNLDSSNRFSHRWMWGPKTWLKPFKFDLKTHEGIYQSKWEELISDLTIKWPLIDKSCNRILFVSFTFGLE